MKRILTKIALILFATIIPLNFASAQEKKEEQKIKIIIDDGTGVKTVLDTTFSNGRMPETINLKDGKVIVITRPGKNMNGIKSGDPENIIVSISSKDDGIDGEENKVIIMNSDSVEWSASQSDKGKHVYVYSGKSETDGEPVLITSSATLKTGTWTDNKEKRVIIIKDGKEIETGLDNTNIDVIVESENEESDPDVTKYIIAKDGVVVTIESNDEVKAREIIKTIEKKMGVKSEK